MDEIYCQILPDDKTTVYQNYTCEKHCSQGCVGFIYFILVYLFIYFSTRIFADTSKKNFLDSVYQ